MSSNPDWSDVKKKTGSVPDDPFGDDPRFADVVPIRVDADPKDDGSLNNKSAMRTAAQTIQDRLERGGGLAGEAVGLTRIDNAIDGWQRGRFYVIGGRTGMGKSLLGLNVAFRAAENKLGVDFLSLEMPTEEQALRLLLARSQVEAWRLKNRALQKNHWDRIIAAAGEMSNWPIYWNDTPGVTVEWVEEQIVRCKQRLLADGSDLFMVVVDHIQKIKGSKGKDRRTEMVHITDQLKNIAKRQNVCVVGLAQINRGTETRGQKDRRPRISELQESGSIEQEADAILLLYREDYYRPKKDWDNVLEVSIPKVRGGEPAFAKFRFTGDCLRVDNLEYSDDEDGNA